MTSLAIPSSLSWYCNAQHSTASNYTLPLQMADGEHGGAKLIHLVHVQRHQKRTPDNLVPNNEAAFNPSEGWQCDAIDQFQYAVGRDGAAKVQKTFEVPSWHPLRSRIWNGDCDAGQLTAGGLQDSFAHGRDLWGIYGARGKNPIKGIGLRPAKLSTLLRTSPEERTFQVAGGLLHGMGFPREKTFESIAMPSTIDGIVPSYSCSHADELRNKINSETTWTEHIASKSELFASVNDVLGTGNLSDWNSWIDHAFDFLSARQCHGHPLPTNYQTGKSISQSIADQVYAEGNWEYNYIWNDSPNADEYTRYSIAVLIKELALLLQSVKDGSAQHQLSLFVGHDGTMVRLFKSLGMPYIMWPGMGSEVNMEIYETNDTPAKHYVRLLSYGATLTSTVKALTGKDGTAEASWAPLENVIGYLNGRLPEDLAAKCA